jgi:hypothetical protein
MAASGGARVDQAAHELPELAGGERGVLGVVAQVVGPGPGGGPSPVVSATARRLHVLVVDRLTLGKQLERPVHARHRISPP